MRKVIVAGNWKMNKTVEESIKFINELPCDILNEDTIDCVICAPFTSLYPLSQIIKNTKLQLGAQNLHWEDKGAFTGEISSSMLLSCGCKWVIIGHSERRQYFGENDINVNLKVKKALSSNLAPIICVGEKLAEREANLTEEVVANQVNRALDDLKLTFKEANSIAIAYEPVWAIGVGAKPCEPNEANRVIGFIRNIIKDKFSTDIANSIRVLYGGNVNVDNIKPLINQSEIDGVLVGGASLKPETYQELVRACRKS